MNARVRNRAMWLIAAVSFLTGAATQMRADQTGTCGARSTTIPFDDVLPGNVFFCSIAEAYFSALANGTTATTYSPSDPVPREQMAAFMTRTMDQTLTRSSKRAALDQYWTTQGADNLAQTTVGRLPELVKSDGADLWVANYIGNTVSRVRASDGKLLETWTGATGAVGVLCAMGKVFVTGSTTGPGQLYQIDPTQPPGAVTTLFSNLRAFPEGIAYDGQRIWTAHYAGPGSVSIITLNPLSATAVFTGFHQLIGAIYDGNNIWVTDRISGTSGKLLKLDSNGAVLLSVEVGSDPQFPAFDGTNIWVPNDASNTVTVVRAAGSLAGTVIATLNGNGLSRPTQAAFDGERILVTNFFGNSVSLWKAADLTPIGTFSVGLNSNPIGSCSDGLHFWIALANPDKLARF